MPMCGAATLLISNHLQLVENVRKISESINNLQLLVCDNIGEAASLICREEIAGVMVHLSSAVDDAQVLELLRISAGTKRPSTVVALTDEYRAKQHQVLRN